MGTLLAALVPVVSFNAVMTFEHFASFLVCSTSLSMMSSFFLIVELSICHFYINCA